MLVFPKCFDQGKGQQRGQYKEIDYALNYLKRVCCSGVNLYENVHFSICSLIMWEKKNVSFEYKYNAKGYINIWSHILEKGNRKISCKKPMLLKWDLFENSPHGSVLIHNHFNFKFLVALILGLSMKYIFPNHVWEDEERTIFV